MEFGDDDCNVYNRRHSCHQYPHGHSDGKHVDKRTKLSRTNRRSTAIDNKRCTSCGTTSTPVWRWGGEAKDTLLCNACSLRIRRSSGKPGRGKSPGERAQKKASHSSAANTTTSDSGPASADEPDAYSAGLSSEDDMLFKERLHDLVLKERDRLLGSWSSLSYEDNWSSSPWTTMSPLSGSSGGLNTSPTTPRHREWESYRVFSGLSDSSARLGFERPMSPYGLGDNSVY